MKHKKIDEVYPYTYIVIRKSDNYKYHGVRYANTRTNTPPIEDLGIKYFTSSKLIKKSFRDNPSDFEFRVAWAFDTTEEALDHEYKVNAKIFLKDDWLNRSYGKNFGEHPDIGKLISNSKTESVIERQVSNLKKYLDTPEGAALRQATSERKKLFWEAKTYEEKLKILENAHNSDKNKKNLEELHRRRRDIADPITGDTFNHLIARKSAKTRKDNGIDSIIGKKRNQIYDEKLAAMDEEEFLQWCEGKSQRAIKGATTRRNRYRNL